jgi:putative nucleotidyltransferase with HDIG domain
VKREEQDPIEIPDARPINTSDSSHDERIATLKSLTPVVSRSEIKEYIDTSEDLRGFSPTVAVLLKATRDPHCTIDHIVKLASGDHALALKLLKLANSAAFNRGEPADSVRKAILRIGLDRLRHAVLTIGVIEHFSDTRYGEQIHLGKFWEHSISCALIAAELAAEVETVDADVAFTMGLLHDVGRLLLAEQLGDRYKDVMATADTLRLPFEQVEGRMLPFTHADVMDRALHRWQFPQQITNPVVFHHLSANNLRIQMRSGLDEAAVLALANRLSHAMLLGSSGNDFVYPTEDICELLRLDGRQLQRIEAEAPGKSLDIKLSLLAQSPHANWTHVRDEYADQVNPDARIHFISSQPGVDAYRILCTSLLDRHKTEGEAADSMETPNCIVMHIASGREISDLCDKFITMERQWQLPQPLPLVIISPKGRMKLDSRLLVPERNLQYLPQPLHVGTYVEAINRAVATQTDRAAA